MTNRRGVIAALAVGGATGALAAMAQGVGVERARRIAFLSTGNDPSKDTLRPFFSAALTNLGWVEGANLTTDVRYASSDLARTAALSAELLALKPDVFVCAVDVYARSAAQATSTVPIVFILGFDPVGLGLVQSLARPGRNATGFAILNYELNAKRLSLFKEAVPRLDKVAVLYRGDDARAQSGLDLLRSAGQAVRIEIVAFPVRIREDIAPAIDKVASLGLPALMNVPEPLFYQERKLIADLCIRHRIAASFGAIEFAEAGALIGYGVDFSQMYRRAAVLVDRILRGASPAAIPVEQADSYELAVNLRTARAIGIELPRSILLQATRIIE